MVLSVIVMGTTAVQAQSTTDQAAFFQTSDTDIYRLVVDSPEKSKVIFNIYNETGKRVFSDRIGNRLIEVKDPSLTHAELDEARKQLMQRLSELENPEPEEQEPEEEIKDGQSEDQYAQV